MHRLGSIEGNGDLLDGTETLGPARYHIDVWQQGQAFKSAAGTIEADARVIWQAFQRGGVTLVLEEGNKINVSVTTHWGGTDAEIKVSGPVPGF